MSDLRKPNYKQVLVKIDKREQVFKLLKLGKKQQEIQKETGFAVGTISRYTKEFKNQNSIHKKQILVEYAKVEDPIEKLKKIESKTVEFIFDVFDETQKKLKDLSANELMQMSVRILDIIKTKQ